MENLILLHVIKKVFIIGLLISHKHNFIYIKLFFYRFSEHFGDVDKVFRPAERSRLVYEILLRCPYRSPEPPLTGKL
jgi:hypothetical protein